MIENKRTQGRRGFRGDLGEKSLEIAPAHHLQLPLAPAQIHVLSEVTMSLIKVSSVAAVLAFSLSLAVAPGCSSPAADSATTTREVTGKVDVSSYDLDNPNVVAESDDGHFFAAPLAADGTFSLNIPAKQAYRLLLTNTTSSGTYKAISYIQWQTEEGVTPWAYCDDGGSIGVGTVKPPPGEVSCKTCKAGKGGAGTGKGSSDTSTKGGSDTGNKGGSDGTNKGGSDGTNKGGSGSGADAGCTVEVSKDGASVSGDCGGWSWDGSWGDDHEGTDNDNHGGKGGGGDAGGGKGGGSGSGSGCSSCTTDADAGASGGGHGGDNGKGGGKAGGTGKGGAPTPAGHEVCDDLANAPAPPVSNCGSKAPKDVHGQSGKGGGKGGKGGGGSDAAACIKPAPPPPPAPPAANPGDACHVNAECGSAMFCCGSQCVAATKP